MSRLVVSRPCKIYVRRGVVRVRCIGGDETVIDSTISAVLIVSSRVLITSSAIRALSNMGVDVVFLARNGEPVARIYPPIINKTVMTRRAQYEALMNGKGVHVAKLVVKAKIMNQANLVRYLGRSRRDEALRDEAVKLDELAMGVEGISDSTGLMEVEAQAARHYWQSLAQVLPPEYGFRGRDQEGRDPFNLMLNYGYGILKYMIEKSLLIHGFDPYAGFLHSDRSGKPSLTLDVMEPFRPVVDKALVFSRIKAEIINGFLSYETRASIVRAVMSEFQSKVYLGARAVTVTRVVDNFIEGLSSYLRGDSNDVDPPVIRWG
ncbi:MAG: CRISPR-associated endonuclease Cas1 [Vulcanisaeta sp.]